MFRVARRLLTYKGNTTGELIIMHKDFCKLNNNRLLQVELQIKELNEKIDNLTTLFLKINYEEFRYEDLNFRISVLEQILE
jgi:hypothetical protein